MRILTFIDRTRAKSFRARYCADMKEFCRQEGLGLTCRAEYPGDVRVIVGEKKGKGRGKTEKRVEAMDHRSENTRKHT